MQRLFNRRLYTTFPKYNLSSIFKKEYDDESQNHTIHQVHPHTVEFFKSEGWSITDKLGSSELKLKKKLDDYTLEMFINCNQEDQESEEFGGVDAVLDLTRTGKEGIVSMDLRLDSDIIIDNVSWYPNASYQKSEELREDNYAGPAIETLDQQLEEALVEKLNELSVTTEFSEKLNNLKVWKEQKEYENWLVKVGNLFE